MAELRERLGGAERSVPCATHAFVSESRGVLRSVATGVLGQRLVGTVGGIADDFVSLTSGTPSGSGATLVAPSLRGDPFLALC